MIDRCSITARLDARRWGPVFEATSARICYRAAERAHPVDGEAFGAFLTHPLHDVLATLTTFRPPVDISVQ